MLEEKKVVGFIEPKDHKQPTMRDVVNLLNAGVHDQAENVFAKIMKRRLADIIGDNIHRSIDSRLIAHPCWVLSESVCLIVKENPTKPTAQMSPQRRGRNAILDEAGDHAVMMGALETRIHNLGGGFFNFVLKQRFTVGHGTSEEAFESTD